MAAASTYAMLSPKFLLGPSRKTSSSLLKYASNCSAPAGLHPLLNRHQPPSLPSSWSSSSTPSSSQQRYRQGEFRRSVHVEAHMKALGIELPPPAGPRANYNIVCQASGNMMYVSGHLPFRLDGTLMTGRIGEDGRDVEYGYQAARWAGLNIVSTLQEQLGGNLDRVERIVKVFGVVQSTDDFKSQHLVMDGCSDVMMEVFGKEVGYHARSAIGTSTLPIDISVEVEAVVQIRAEML